MTKRWPHPYIGYARDGIPDHLEYDTDGRFVLVEEGRYNDTCVTSFDTLEDAADCWASQEYAEDWAPELVWDQVTGDIYEGVVLLKVVWRKTSETPDSVQRQKLIEAIGFSRYHTAHLLCAGAADNSEYVRGVAELLIDTTHGLNQDDHKELLMELISRS